MSTIKLELESGIATPEEKDSYSTPDADAAPPAPPPPGELLTGLSSGGPDLDFLLDEANLAMLPASPDLDDDVADLVAAAGPASAAAGPAYGRGTPPRPEGACPFCTRHDHTAAAADNTAREVGRNKRRQAPRKENPLALWNAKHGYAGPPYCKACSESFRSHLLRAKGKNKPRSGCSRANPCDACCKILAQFDRSPAVVFEQYDTGGKAGGKVGGGAAQAKRPFDATAPTGGAMAAAAQLAAEPKRARPTAAPAAPGASQLAGAPGVPAASQLDELLCRAIELTGSATAASAYLAHNAERLETFAATHQGPTSTVAHMLGELPHALQVLTGMGGEAAQAVSKKLGWVGYSEVGNSLRPRAAAAPAVLAGGKALEVTVEGMEASGSCSGLRATIVTSTVAVMGLCVGALWLGRAGAKKAGARHAEE